MNVKNDNPDSRNGTDAPASRSDEELGNELTVAFGRALLALGKAGQPVEASRIAAAGFATVRHDWPDAAKRINGIMHSLARMPEASSLPDQIAQEEK